MSRKVNRLVMGLLIVALLLPLALTGCTPAEPTATPKPKPTVPPSTPVPTAAPPALGTAENPIVLSMVPSGDAPEIIASAEMITALLMDKTGYVIEGHVATSYAAVIEAMGTSKAHMGTLATFAYLLAHRPLRQPLLQGPGNRRSRHRHHPAV